MIKPQKRFLRSIIYSLFIFLFLLPSFAYANDFKEGLLDAISWGRDTGHLSSLPLAPPLKDLKKESILGNIGLFLMDIILAAAVLAIIIGGFLYILSAGDESKTARAKKIIFFALIGLSIVTLRLLIINILFSWLGLKDAYTPKETAGFVVNILYRIFIFAQAIVASIAVLAIVWGGFQYLTSGGDENKSAKGKQTIITAIAGLFIVYISILIANTVGKIIAGTRGAATPFLVKISNIISFSLSFTSIIAVVAFIYGGITYLTSGGSDEKAQRGKHIIIYAVIGMVIILISAAIVNTVISL